MESWHGTTTDTKLDQPLEVVVVVVVVAVVVVASSQPLAIFS